MLLHREFGGTQDLGASALGPQQDSPRRNAREGWCRRRSLNTGKREQKHPVPGDERTSRLCPVPQDADGAGVLLVLRTLYVFEPGQVAGAGRPCKQLSLTLQVLDGHRRARNPDPRRQDPGGGGDS